MRKNNVQNDKIRYLVSAWRLKVLISEMQRTKNHAFIKEGKFDDALEAVELMSLVEIDNLISTFDPGSGTHSGSYVGFYKELKSVTIMRLEILRIVEFKEDQSLIASDMQYILDTINIKPSGFNKLRALHIRYFKVLDLLLDRQYQVFNECLNKHKYVVPLYQLSRRLFWFMHIKLDNKNVAIEDLLDVVLIQKTMYELYNPEGYIVEDLPFETDGYLRLINWVPKTEEDFNTLYILLKSIKEDLLSVDKYHPNLEA